MTTRAEACVMQRFPTYADCLDYLEWLRWPARPVVIREDGGLGTAGSCVMDAVAAHQ